jgi:alpha-amylase
MQTEMRIPWVAVVPVPQSRASPPAERLYHGDGRDLLLQGFHWHSHRGVQDGGQRRSWYRVLTDNAAAIKNAGFTWVWFPPCSDSLAPQGYIPRKWNVLDTSYGNEHELRLALRALDPVKGMADIILNHRVGVHTSGADFEEPRFHDNHAAITRDDESGIGTGNPDTGERYAAGRDLDHTNHGVRAAATVYLRKLRNVGFKGWRYDLVKGFHGMFVGEYNDSTSPEFSVGEFYDTDRQKVTDWIDSTGGKSTAFDFPTRYLLYDACTKDDYGRLRSTNCGRVVPAGLIGFWSSRAVTFLDNHDTEYRRDEEHRHQHNDTRHFPGKHVEMGYAYLLTHPGIPCIFWSHYFDWGPGTRNVLERLIKLRKDRDIHATSSVEIREAGRGLYAAVIDGRVAVKLGGREWHPGGGWHPVVAGEKYVVWARN